VTLSPLKRGGLKHRPDVADWYRAARNCEENDFENLIEKRLRNIQLTRVSLKRRRGIGRRRIAKKMISKT